MQLAYQLAGRHFPVHMDGHTYMPGMAFLAQHVASSRDVAKSTSKSEPGMHCPSSCWYKHMPLSKVDAALTPHHRSGVQNNYFGSRQLKLHTSQCGATSLRN